MAAPLRLATTCCIVGGGPAGLMLGVLLARAGIAVQVLEKHADFLRDFRGDTIHPSTMTVLQEMGCLDAFLQLPHQRIEEVSVIVGGRHSRVGRFRHLPVPAPFIAMMPQWHFLDFMAREGRRHPSFQLAMQTPAMSLLRTGDRVTGVRASGPAGEVDIQAELVIGADGRHSTVRREADLPVHVLGAPIDVLWLRLPRIDTDPGEVLGHAETGELLVMIDRGDYWQCAMVVPKDGADAVRAAGLPRLRERLRALSPWLGDRVQALATWDDVKVLSVAVDRLERWTAPGLLCLGDSAHAMSPIGGVGVNLAVQDAVAAAREIVAAHRAGRPLDDAAQRTARRRHWPTVATQWAQVQAQSRLIAPLLHGAAPVRQPRMLRLLDHVGPLRDLAGRLVGLGVRPEHLGPLATAANAGPAV